MSIYELLIISELTNKKELFSLKIHYKYFTDICNEYNLIDKGIFKEYYLGDKVIIKNSNCKIQSMSKIIHSEVVNENLLNEKEFLHLDEENSNLDQFYDTESENIYNSFESEDKGILTICKKYSDYITLSFYSDKKELIETIKNKYY